MSIESLSMMIVVRWFTSRNLTFRLVLFATPRLSASLFRSRFLPRSGLILRRFLFSGLSYVFFLHLSILVPLFRWLTMAGSVTFAASTLSCSSGLRVGTKVSPSLNGVAHMLAHEQHTSTLHFFGVVRCVSSQLRMRSRISGSSVWPQSNSSIWQSFSSPYLA